MKVTFETKAWLSKYNNASPAELRTPEGASSLHYTPHDMGGHGDAFIGNATVTIELPDDRTMVDNKIAALRTVSANIRAEATAKCTAIEGQIQQLLAIENKPSRSEKP